MFHANSNQKREEMSIQIFFKKALNQKDKKNKDKEETKKDIAHLEDSTQQEVITIINMHASKTI